MPSGVLYGGILLYIRQSNGSHIAGNINDNKDGTKNGFTRLRSSQLPHDLYFYI